MRTRINNVIDTKSSWPGATGNYIQYFCGMAPSDPYAYTHTGHSDIPTRYSNERMSDELGRGGTNECIHRKLVVRVNDETPPVILPLASGPGGQVVYSSSGQIWPYWNFGDTSDIRSWDTEEGFQPPRWQMTVSPEDELRLKENALEKGRQLKADVLLNLIEANQLPGTVKTLAAFLPQMAKTWSKATYKVIGTSYSVDLRSRLGGDKQKHLRVPVKRLVRILVPPLRESIRNASSSYLAYKFGVSPIISDIMAINRHAAKLKSDIERHMRGRPKSFSSVGEVATVFDKTETNYPYLGTNYVSLKYHGYVMERPVVRYVLRAKPHVYKGNSLLKGIDYVTSRFATSPASLAWERIPFSFVLDWFVDLRGVLRTVDQCLGFSPYQIVGFTRSLSYHLATSKSIVYRNTCSGGVIRDYIAATCEYKHYERLKVPASPKLAAWNPRFGKNQYGVSAALVAQVLSTLGAKR